MKQPGPEHPISVRPYFGRIRVIWQGRAIADSDRALELREAGYDPVYYLPRADVDMEVLAPSAHRTHCPYKGEARYWSLGAGAEGAADAAWSYEDPYPAVADIRGAMAFDPARVEAIELLDS